MNAPELSTLSLQAFAAVLGVLGLLALAVQLLTAIFRAPAPAAPSTPGSGTPRARPRSSGGAATSAHDPFVQAALHAAVGQVAPGAVVARVDRADPTEEDSRR